ncbi:Transcriptional activator protein ExaE [Variovorax sp. SRS16]|uniref:response regulator n=1 Tax=Variovorax sp. SRS16 TaxID=282217 RepID=UPI001316D8C6|nr:response regulator transcription factor [Variovorax sp. SRS16]VTU26833.1 Transcriptional activator protein ExaE [Variovorax sp. SRS16]
MIRLLLVDDHPVVRAGYRHLLEQDGDMTVVAQAGHADEACALFARHEPDLTATDLSMPGSSGLELIRRLRERVANARTLIFSMHDSEMLVRRALERGALGFVSKSSAPECLIDAVHTVLEGRRYLSLGLPQRLLDGAAEAPGVPPWRTWRFATGSSPPRRAESTAGSFPCRRGADPLTLGDGRTCVHPNE